MSLGGNVVQELRACYEEDVFVSQGLREDGDPGGPPVGSGHSPDVLRALVACCEGPAVSFSLVRLCCWSVLSHLHLALKHPEARGQASLLAGRFARALEEALDLDEALRGLCDAAWAEIGEVHPELVEQLKAEG